MPKRVETIEIAGRDVTISNPDKVYFPKVGHTKLDLVRYYLFVADGALRGVLGRPMALKRFVDGSEGEFFFQKRAPEKRPAWIETVELAFPSGRTAHEIVLRDAAGLAWVVNLGCIDLNPHPVRADDLDHPDELRIDLDPVPGVPWEQIREVAMVARAVLDDHGLVGWPKTSGSRGIHVNVRIRREWTFSQVRRAALAIAREVERRAPTLATSKWWKEERHGVFIDYNQNARDRTVASAYSVRPLPDARVSAPLTWAEVPDCRPEDFTLVTVPGRYAAIGDPGAGIDDAAGGLESLLELVARQEAEGLGDAPWPPNYRKQEGEPPRVQPSRQRRPAADYDTPEAAARREQARAAMERRMAADADAQTPGALRGTRPTPTGRRRSSVPVIEIARAAKKEDALAGLDRWQQRWPAAAAALEPADVLVDSMRGRSTTWTRIRVNLIHVSEDDRPPQEPLDPDYDPWAGVTAADEEAWRRSRRGREAGEAWAGDEGAGRTEAGKADAGATETRETEPREG